MKPFSLLVLFSLLVCGMNAQVNSTINQTSNPTTYNTNRGALHAQQYLQAPRRTLNIPFKNVDSIGNIQIDPLDTSLCYFTGRAWRKVVFQSQLNGMLGNYLPSSTFNWNDLPGKPTTFPPAIHTHQISDVTGLQASINDKFNAADTTGKWYPRNSNPSGFLTSVPAQSFVSLTGKPTTLGGYGIVDAYPLSTNPANYINQSSADLRYTQLRDTIGGPGLGNIMTTSSANASLNAKVSKTLTLTINGLAQDLSTNRTWSITTITGNAGTATTLQTARNINGVPFNGSANITIPVVVTINPPTFNVAITSGTPFQPNATGSSQIIVSSTLTGGVAGVSGSSVVAMSATQNGTYTNIGPGTSFLLSALTLVDNRDSSTIPVPPGYWIRVTNTSVGVGATLSSTYTRWNL